MIHDTWLYFVVLAHLLNAFVVLIDKQLVTRLITHPIVYAFYVSLLSGVAFVLLPFGVVTVPSLSIMFYCLMAAICYFFSIVYLYRALQHTDPSDAVPVAGSLTAISTFFFSFIVFEQSFTWQVFVGSTLLIIGTLLISHFRFTKITAGQIAVSGIFSGVSAVFTKLVFEHLTFANGFFWTRMANVLLAVIVACIPMYHRYINHNLEHSSPGTKMLIIGNKVIAGIAALMILFAIKLAPVQYVNALAGLQYVFLLTFAIIWGKHKGHFFSYNDGPHDMVHKILSTALIVLGFMIFVS